MTTRTLRHVRALLAGLLVLAGLASTAEAVTTALRDSLAPRGSRLHNLNVGMSDHHLTVRGQGRDSDDLDCWVYDSRGELVDSDVDMTDYCILDTPGLGAHYLLVRNLGRYTNQYEIRQRRSLD